MSKLLGIHCPKIEIIKHQTNQYNKSYSSASSFWMFKDDNDTLLLCDKHKVLPLQRPCTVSSPTSWQTGRVAAHVKPYFLGKTLLKHARNESCNLQIYLYLSQWTFIFVGVFEQLSSRYFKINLLGLPLIFTEDKDNDQQHHDGKDQLGHPWLAHFSMHRMGPALRAEPEIPPFGATKAWRKVAVRWPGSCLGCTLVWVTISDAP